jgi:hypothetical protein
MGLSVGEEVLEFSMYLLGGRVGVYGVSLVGLVVEGGKEGVNPGFVLQTSKKLFVVEVTRLMASIYFGSQGPGEWVGEWNGRVRVLESFWVASQRLSLGVFGLSFALVFARGRFW